MSPFFVKLIRNVKIMLAAYSFYALTISINGFVVKVDGYMANNRFTLRFSTKGRLRTTYLIYSAGEEKIIFKGYTLATI
jgi:hypothetical protein